MVNQQGWIDAKADLANDLRHYAELLERAEDACDEAGAVVLRNVHEGFIDLMIQCFAAGFIAQESEEGDLT